MSRKRHKPDPTWTPRFSKSLMRQTIRRNSRWRGTTAERRPRLGPIGARDRPFHRLCALGVALRRGGELQSGVSVFAETPISPTCLP